MSLLVVVVVVVAVKRIVVVIVFIFIVVICSGRANQGSWAEEIVKNGVQGILTLSPAA